MNLDMNQHETYITMPDDSAKIEREAIPPPGQPKVVIPGPTDDTKGLPSSRKPTAAHSGKLHGMSLAWRGIRLLGLAFGISAAWFFAAWIHHGRVPLGLFQPRIMPSIYTPPSLIWPPTWLAAIVGLLLFISLCMMLLGIQDVTPRINFKNKAET